MGTCTSNSRSSASGAGSGGFVRSQVPILRQKNGIVSLGQSSGYSANVDGYDVYIQKVSGGYRGNSYGYLMNKTYKTLAEAKDGIANDFRNYLQSGDNRLLTEVAKRTADYLKTTDGIKMRTFSNMRRKFWNEAKAQGF